MTEFLKKYWADIEAAILQIYYFIKNLILGEDAE